MSLDDPNAWAQGAAAFKSIFEGLRSAIALVKETQEVDKAPTTAQRQLVDDALDKASKAALLAEAELAKALGYELCKCEFPPIPMRTVGNFMARGGREGPVYECPKCGYNSAGPFNYQRIAPPREIAA
jgi:hypothetical protein